MREWPKLTMRIVPGAPCLPTAHRLAIVGVGLLVLLAVGLALSHAFLLTAPDHDLTNCPVCCWLKQLPLAVQVLILTGMLIPGAVVLPEPGLGVRSSRRTCQPRAPPVPSFAVQ